MKQILNFRPHLSYLHLIILILSIGAIFVIIANSLKIGSLNKIVKNLEREVQGLTQIAKSLTRENVSLKNEDTRSQLNAFNDILGKYEAVKEKTASYKSKGVNVESVEKELPNTINLILGKKYPEADKILTQMDADLENLWKAKQASDAAARAKYSSPTCSGIPSSGYCYTSIKTASGTFLVHIVALSLSKTVITDTANPNDCADNCPTKPLLSYVRDNGASIGINGTYFCPPDYASCAGKVNTYDMSVYNSNLNKWLNQGTLPWSNRAMMAFTAGGTVFYPKTSSFSGLSGLRGAIVNFPGLVANGANIVWNYQLTSAQLTKGTRGGIGIKGDTIYLVVTSSASVPDLASIMMALGVNSALNLDGGGSSALVYNGAYKVGPGRSLPNAIVFK